MCSENLRKLGKLRSSDGGCLDFDGKYVKTLRVMTHGFLLNILKYKTQISLISYPRGLFKQIMAINNKRKPEDLKISSPLFKQTSRCQPLNTQKFDTNQFWQCFVCSQSNMVKTKWSKSHNKGEPSAIDHPLIIEFILENYTPSLFLLMITVLDLLMSDWNWI